MVAETAGAIRRVCLVGTGVIGSGWAARYLARGLDVMATDPAPEAERRLREGVARAWPALQRLGLAAGASQERLRFVADLTRAVAGADFVQEKAPELTDDLVTRMVEGTAIQAAGHSVRQLEQRRDDFLVRLLGVLRDYWPPDARADTAPTPNAVTAAPPTAHETLDGTVALHEALDGPPVLHEAEVLPEWIDYNGHMSEAYYVLVFGYATDALLGLVGITAAYREQTAQSLYTVQAHLTCMHSVTQGERLRITTQVLEVDQKRLRVFHTMYRAETETALASEELLLVHVDMTGPRSADFAPEVLSRLQRLCQTHRALPVPRQAGRITMSGAG